MKSQNVKLILLLFFVLSCRNTPPSGQTGIQQGIKGKITWLEGNQMPSPADPPTKRTEGIPVQREIHIYNLINIRDTESNNGFFSKIKGTPVRKIMSGKDGKFEIAIKPGEYSLFVKEENGLYANLFDTNNNVYPVVVNEDKVTEVKVIIDYNAAY